MTLILSRPDDVEAARMRFFDQPAMAGLQSSASSVKPSRPRR